ncbi:hypothetical protein ACFFK0_14270 [Paenibacillus chartarius]|uniref:4-hydroxybenzoate synthetase n=1 Tax=Paenibacillus chartarius TaxID=747481 RepID=A0ABV6DLT3_9BACL
MTDQRLERNPIALLGELLATEEKTTDMLERLVGKQIFVRVLSQQTTGRTIHRESVLYSEELPYIVSHNFVVIDSEQIPRQLHELIAIKKIGIGKAMNQLELASSRHVCTYGWIKKDNVVDFEGNYSDLQCVQGEQFIPFKRYSITFRPFNRPGMRLIEYFNPILIHTREEW